MEETKDSQIIDDVNSITMNDIKEIDLESINPDEDIDEEQLDEDENDDDDIDEEGQIGGAETDDEDDEDDEDDDDEDEGDEDVDEEKDDDTDKTPKKIVQHLESILASQPNIDTNTEEAEYDEDSDVEDYLEKFDNDIKEDIIKKYHPDLMQSNYDEISALTKIIRDEQGNIIDPIHNTLPILTKFEKARVLGLRAKQINNGAEPFVQVPDNVIEGHIIAELELEQRVLPFIVVRPLPNGKKEYWRIQDLKLIDY